MPATVVVAYATAAGVLIDLDHFVIARLKTGTWEAAQFCLRNPAAAVADQDRIFDRGEVGVLPRLFSHLLLAGVAVPLFALASTSLAVVTAAVLYAHVLTDVAWDIRQFDRRTDLSADEHLRTIR